MNSALVARRITLAIGGSALVAMGVLTAGCGTGTKEEPKTTSTPSSPAPSATVSPTEKSAGGPNSFSPTVHPGDGGSSCTSIVNGVCTR